jgi:hypothetical protein
MAKLDFETMFPEGKLLGTPTYSDFRNVLRNMNEAGYFDGEEEQGYIKADGSVPMTSGYNPVADGDILTYKFFTEKAELNGPIFQKTLGPTGDFKNFNELYEFYNNRLFPVGTLIKVMVQDGVHRFEVNKKYLLEIESAAVPIEIYGTSADDCTIEILPEFNNTSYAGCINSKLNTWCYIHDLTIKEISGSTTAILLKFDGASGRLSNVKLHGGKRAVLVQYNASLIGWNIDIYNPVGSQYSTFKVWSNSNVILWYGINIYNDNGDSKADGLYSGGNSNIQINYTNFEHRGLRVAIQPQWGGIIYCNTTSSIKIVNCEKGFLVQDHSFFIGDKLPIFTNTATQFVNEVNTVLKDGSFTFINRKDYKFENGFINNENGTASLLNSIPSDIQTSGDKSIPTLEYLLSPEFGNSLPISEPGEAGRLWNDSGFLKISQ